MSRGISVRLRMSLGVGRVRGGERVCRRKAWVRVKPCPWVPCYHYGPARTARVLWGGGTGGETLLASGSLLRLRLRLTATADSKGKDESQYRDPSLRSRMTKIWLAGFRFELKDDEDVVGGSRTGWVDEVSSHPFAGSGTDGGAAWAIVCGLARLRRRRWRTPASWHGGRGCCFPGACAGEGRARAPRGRCRRCGS